MPHAPTLSGVLAAFIWMRVSLPVYTTRPVMNPRSLRMQPPSGISFMVTGTSTIGVPVERQEGGSSGVCTGAGWPSMQQLPVTA